MADGVFIKTLVLDRDGLLVPQHAHSFAHVSVLVRGKIRVWRGEAYVGVFAAPAGITIAAHVKHTFVSLTPAIILCVHDIGQAEGVSIEAEHHLEGPA